MAAAAALLILGACHKGGPDGAADGASSRGLQVEAYDPVIPKAPLKGKLETMTNRPSEAPAAVSGAAASTEAPASADSAPPPKA